MITYVLLVNFHYTATLMSNQWIADKSVRKWMLPRRPVGAESDVQEMACGHFQKKYNKVQGMIQQVGCMDELLSGKPKDQDDEIYYNVNCGLT